jgi:hypothetical protein
MLLLGVDRPGTTRMSIISRGDGAKTDCQRKRLCSVIRGYAIIHVFSINNSLLKKMSSKKSETWRLPGCRGPKLLPAVCRRLHGKMTRDAKTPDIRSSMRFLRSRYIERSVKSLDDCGTFSDPERAGPRSRETSSPDIRSLKSKSRLLHSSITDPFPSTSPSVRPISSTSPSLQTSSPLILPIPLRPRRPDPVDQVRGCEFVFRSQTRQVNET